MLPAKIQAVLDEIRRRKERKVTCGYRQCEPLPQGDGTLLFRAPVIPFEADHGLWERTWTDHDAEAGHPKRRLMFAES